MPLSGRQKDQLREAISTYSFPAVYFDFHNNRQVRTTSIRAVEAAISSQLHSEEIETVKHGLANILYWGFAQVDFRDNRVEDFVSNVSDNQLTKFRNLLSNSRTRKMTEIKQIGMPQYSGMSFISKILMFLNPDAYCVLDRQIAKLRTPNSPKALNSLAFGPKETRIRVSQRNEDVYDRWRVECQAINQRYFESQYRVVDIERGFFNLIQQGYLLDAQAIYNDA